MTTTTLDAARGRVERNHQAFVAAVGRVRRAYEAGDLADAAVYACVASNLATWMHPGQFASGELERLTAAIGRSAAGATEAPPRQRGDEVRDVLHVFSRTLTVGGHTRMVWRWMGLDDGRRHSVAVTRQAGRPVPDELLAAAEATGGAVTVLGGRSDSMLSRARELHSLATSADVVVLHVDPEDAIPGVAFADRSQLPPVLYLNHADHIFWLGVGASDLVVNLRHSGARLSPARRGVATERNAFIPIALDDRQRTQSRAEAKQQLGLPPDSILLATVARAIKFDYRSDAGESYLDAVLPVVQAFDDVELVLVGPRQRGEFQDAHDASGGRIRALGERTDNETLYQAVDVYIDSYPQMSPTSLLEAGSYDVPLIALCPQIDDAEILCADAPGIDGRLVRTRSVEEFRRELTSLITDPQRRADLGTATRADIQRLHVGSKWHAQLEALYRRALDTPPLAEVPPIPDDVHLDPPDTTIAMGSPPVVEFDDMLIFHMRLLSFRSRARSWLRATRNGKRPSPSLLLSDSAATQLKRILPAREGT